MENAELRAALSHLAAADPVMARLIDERGPLHLTPTDEYFFTLVDAIASQQVSSKAAATIISRIRALLPDGEPPAPVSILALTDESLQAVGLSWRKVSYIKDLSQRVHSGELDLAHISQMGDEEIIKSLVAVKGIGPWTAEMFLIFSLARRDVLAVADYGLQVAMKQLYNLDSLPKPAVMHEIAEPWRPYRSYASLYLWRSLDNSPKVAAMEAPTQARPS